MFCTTDSLPLLDQWGFIVPFNDYLSGHPSLQYTLICLQTGSSSCVSMIYCNRASEAGSDAITLPMCACISSSSIVDFTVWLRGWSLESASAMYIFFPGTCLISLKWNLISRILNLWILGESWSSWSESWVYSWKWMVLPFDVLIKLAQVNADPDLVTALRCHHHGSTPISGFINSGYDSCLQHPV